MTRSVNAIRSLRLARAWKQADLAVRIGSTQSDVSAYETGRVVPVNHQRTPNTGGSLLR